LSAGFTLIERRWRAFPAAGRSAWAFLSLSLSPYPCREGGEKTSKKKKEKRKSDQKLNEGLN